MHGNMNVKFACKENNTHLVDTRVRLTVDSAFKCFINKGDS
jgi:hypothetical protein